jgi:transposase InsO family protein
LYDPSKKRAASPPLTVELAATEDSISSQKPIQKLSVPKNQKNLKKQKTKKKEQCELTTFNLSGTDNLEQLTIPVSIRFANQTIHSKAMIDSGATSNFIDQTFTITHNIPSILKGIPARITTVDGQPLVTGDVTHETVALKMETKHSTEEQIQFNIAGLGKHSIILGRPWLQSNNPDINWKTNAISARSTQQDLNAHSTEEQLSTQTPSSKLPDQYRQFESVFSKEEANILPEHRKYDMTIELQPDSTPPFLPLYSLSSPELQELRKYIDENLEKGHIQHSKSPAGAPILFVKKKDGSLRLCVDYRKLNSITVKNRYPLPLITEILGRLTNSKIFTKIDLRGAYSLVRMKESDQWKTAFRTRYGHFEYRVMPFGLTNAPATFQHLMNDIFKDCLDIFIIIYLDDLLVFSDNEFDHIQHVSTTLQRLRDNHLFAKLEKCEFHTTTTEFLGHIISPTGISMCPQKVQTIQQWPRPTNVKQLQSFLGFSNYYRKFISNYSGLAAPLTALLRKDVPFVFAVPQQQAFESLLKSFTTAPILSYFDPTFPITVETDASDYAMGAILSQTSASDGKLHPVAFWSRKFLPAELNYEIHDKELLAIKDAFQEWRSYLIGAEHSIRVLTDHRNLEYFMTSRMLNRRQARWAMFFSDFNFRIEYRPGRLQEQADALSRRSDYTPDSATKTSSNFQLLLKPQNISTIQPFQNEPALVLFPQLLDHLLHDSYYNSTVTKMDSVPLSGYTLRNNLLFRYDKLYIPECSYRLDIIKNRHDSLSAGHYGSRKTIELITRDYWWPKLDQFVKDYISTCGECLRSKSSRHLPYGPLNPLPTASAPWQIVTLDFVVKLPLSNNHDSILVVVDTFTKMAHFIPVKETITAEQTAKTYLAHIFKLHGAPRTIISDRGPHFKSKFWKTFWSSLNVDIRLSTSYHPQTDGQTERINQIMEQYLRIFTNYNQNNWFHLLPSAEFSYNNTFHTSIQMTPFFASYAHHPRFDTLQITNSEFPAINEHHIELLSNQTLLARTLDNAKHTYKTFADKKRLPGPVFTIDDHVMLNSKFITTQRPSKKLDSKRLGPFRIIEKINDVAFKLELPPTMKIHPVFHVSLLEKYKPSAIPNRAPPTLPPIVVDDALEYEVESILDSRFRSKQLEYLVHWKGYDPSHRTWEPSQNMLHCPDLLAEFHSSFPSKPKLLHSVHSLKPGGTVRTQGIDVTPYDTPPVLRAAATEF